MQGKWNVTALLTLLAVSAPAFLLVLSGCGSTPSPSTLPSPPTGTPLPPAVGEDYPPPTLPAYVPPPTEAPWPTPLPEPTATPRPTLEEGRVVRGWGNFPRLAVVSVASDGKRWALYLVQGDTAKQLVAFEARTDFPVAYGSVRLSPSGRHVAYRVQGDTEAIEVVDVESPRRIVLHQATVEPTPDPESKGPRYVDLPTSLAWLDDTHILYTVRKPYECSYSEEAGPSCAAPGELWEVDLGGEKRLLLAVDRLYAVVGISPDGRRVYFDRLAPNWQPGSDGGSVGLYSLDLASGVTTTLWPREGDTTAYGGYTVLTLPGGGQRAFFTYPWKDAAAFTMLDLASGQTTEFRTDGNFYEGPGNFLWSPHSDDVFIFQVAGHIDRADVASRQVQTLAPGGWELLTWSPEGIVRYISDFSQRKFVLQLLDESGQMQGEISFAP